MKKINAAIEKSKLEAVKFEGPRERKSMLRVSQFALEWTYSQA